MKAKLFYLSIIFLAFAVMKSFDGNSSSYFQPKVNSKDKISLEQEDSESWPLIGTLKSTSDTFDEIEKPVGQFESTEIQQKLFSIVDLSELASSDQGKEYLDASYQVLFKLLPCIGSDDACSQSPSLRNGGVEFLDPNNTEYHFYIERALDYIHAYVAIDGNTIGAEEAGLVLAALSVQHRDIPIAALDILLSNSTDYKDMGRIIEASHSLVGPVVSKILLKLARAGKFFDQESSHELLFEEVLYRLKTKDAHRTSSMMFQSITDLGFSKKEFEYAVSVHCSNNNSSNMSAGEKEILRGNLQRQIAVMGIEKSPGDYCRF